MIYLIKILLYKPLLLVRLKKLLAIHIVLLIFSCDTNSGSPNESLTNDDTDGISYNEPALIFVPDSFEIEVGDKFITTVYVMGPEKLRGISVTIEYDTTKLKIDFLNDGNFSSGANSVFFIDTVNSGLIDIVSVYMSNNTQSISNDISIAQVAFESISSGISQINFNQKSEMVDPDGNQIQIRHRGVGFINAE